MKYIILTRIFVHLQDILFRKCETSVPLGIIDSGLLDQPGIIISKTVDTRDLISVSKKAIRKVASDKSCTPLINCRFTSGFSQYQAIDDELAMVIQVL